MWRDCGHQFSQIVNYNWIGFWPSRNERFLDFFFRSQISNLILPMEVFRCCNFQDILFSTHWINLYVVKTEHFTPFIMIYSHCMCNCCTAHWFPFLSTTSNAFLWKHQLSVYCPIEMLPFIYGPKNWITILWFVRTKQWNEKTNRRVQRLKRISELAAQSINLFFPRSFLNSSYYAIGIENVHRNRYASGYWAKTIQEYSYRANAIKCKTNFIIRITSKQNLLK